MDAQRLKVAGFVLVVIPAAVLLLFAFGETASGDVGGLVHLIPATPLIVLAAVAKTRRARWIELPDDLWEALDTRLGAREDRDPDAPLFGDATADRLRTAIGRACNAAGVPRFSPHALRHRRISLLHKRGLSWAEIGDLVGQRSRIVTADTYSHVLGEYHEIDRAALLKRVR